MCEPALHTQALHTTGFLMLLILNAFLAYFVNLTNFLVTRHTSALTLQVLGNAKGVIAAGVSVLLFKNQLTSLGVLGYGVTVSGVFAYSEVCYVGVDVDLYACILCTFCVTSQCLSMRILFHTLVSISMPLLVFISIPLE